eukprot:TRINITY_DN1877_c0_g1_i1.p1 TRINITY_DN1877_c0_g1~~TRINITY_DN1877_c0_g1_i1.p1  ORF type:complete len:580 (-),score=99.92 TRINITY_DN1877_c0_g1_i1:476-2215(-)
MPKPTLRLGSVSFEGMDLLDKPSDSDGHITRSTLVRELCRVQAQNDEHHAEICKLLRSLQSMHESLAKALGASSANAVSVFAPTATEGGISTKSKLTHGVHRNPYDDLLLNKDDVELDLEARRKEMITRKELREAEQQRYEQNRSDGWSKHQASGVLKQIAAENRSDASDASSCQSLTAFVEGPLNIFTACMLCLNAVVMILHSQHMGHIANESLRIDTSSFTVQGWTQDVFTTLDLCFCILYVVDLLLQVTVLRWKWLFNEYTGKLDKSNIFDAVVVIVGLMDQIPATALKDGATGFQLLKVFRFLKVIRTARLVRMLSFVAKLKALMLTCYASVGALFWSMVMLFVIIVIAGLFLTQLTHDFIMNEENDYEDREWVNKYYGSAMKATWTMFEVTFSGGWPGVCRPLMQRVSSYFATIFIVYITLVQFAFLRIIGALLLKETLAAAADNTMFAIQERERSRKHFMKKITGVFKDADESGDEQMSRAEFYNALRDTTMRDYLSTLDIEVHEVDILFDLLDDGDGLISIQEFCQGLPRLKGEARALDVVTIIHDNRVIQQQLRDLGRSLAVLSSTVVGGD